MIELLEQARVAGLVNATKHPTLPLTIHNYSPECQWSRAWTPVTLAARGLVTHDVTGEIVARGFPKFFNYTEVPLEKWVYNTPMTCYDKADGSFGICYETPDGYAVATRGSFASDQALHATEVLRDKYPDFRQPEGITTLWEIIYPENRIVVGYDFDDLVLLGAVENRAGIDIPLWEIDWWDGPRVEHFGVFASVDDVYRKATGNEFNEREGIVAVWHRPNAPAFRLKFKNPRYLQLHKIMTNVNPRRIWEYMRAGEDVEALIAETPDEFYDFYMEQVQSLQQDFDAIKASATQKALEVRDLPDRKTIALALQSYPLRGLVFSILDGKDCSDAIWKMLRPTAGAGEVEV